MDTMICTRCLNQDYPRSVVNSGGLVLWWMFVLSPLVALLIADFDIFKVGVSEMGVAAGIATIFGLSALKSGRTVKCRVCGNEQFVEPGTPHAKGLVESRQRAMQPGANALLCTRCLSVGPPVTSGGAPGCSQCGSPDLIPPGSPRGQQLLAPMRPPPPNPGGMSSALAAWLALGGFLLVVGVMYLMREL